MALVVKNLPANTGDVRATDWEDPLEEGQQLTPLFLPGETHGQRSLLDCSPQSGEETGMKQLSTHSYSACFSLSTQ